VNQWENYTVTRQPKITLSFSKPDTILNVAYLNKPSVDPVAKRTKAVAVVANTEATKAQHRSLLKVDQTDSTSDDLPQRLTTKEVSEMLPEVRPKRSTLPTPIPLVARTINFRSMIHGYTHAVEPRTDKVTICSMTTTQETSFQNP
jgi:hypothetical protein